jgi:peroxiredoxin
MKTKLFAVIAASSLLGSVPCALAASADDAPAKAPKVARSPAATDLQELVKKVQTQLKDKEGKKSEADFEGVFKEFDALLAKYKDDKSDDVAQILMMKAMLYTQVLDNDKKGEELMQQLKKDFPDSRQAKSVDQILASMKQQEESKKIQRSLAEGTKFPDFNEKDLAGKPLSVANYKGKVVLVDFWATWCGPCVGELPNVLKAYEKHHDKGFEIIGISLDSDESKLKNFIKDKNVTWQQYFDGLGWKSKLGTKYGVNSIPATYLLDGEGKIIGKNLRGEALEEAVGKALAKK